VLRFDKRGVGESTGYFPDALTTDFATDVAAAVNYLTFRKTVDRRRIGLIGHSEGGLIALMIAARNHNIAFVVLLAGPGVAGPELVAKQAESEVLLGGGNPATAIETAREVGAIAAIVNREQGHLSKLNSDPRGNSAPAYPTPPLILCSPGSTMPGCSPCSPSTRLTL
jgi:pimeloyl-ACP methyl ester carboxylesterase